MVRTLKTFEGAEDYSGDSMDVEDIVRNVIVGVIGLYLVLKLVEILFNIPVPFV